MHCFYTDTHTLTQAGILKHHSHMLNLSEIIFGKIGNKYKKIKNKYTNN